MVWLLQRSTKSNLLILFWWTVDQNVGYLNKNSVVVYTDNVDCSNTRFFSWSHNRPHKAESKKRNRRDGPSPSTPSSRRSPVDPVASSLSARFCRQSSINTWESTHHKRKARLVCSRFQSCRHYKINPCFQYATLHVVWLCAIQVSWTAWLIMTETTYHAETLDDSRAAVRHKNTIHRK